MYLTDYINGKNCDSSVSKFAMDGTTYTAYYKYWLDELFQRVMGLFIWNNAEPIPQKEIEKRLLMSGRVAITNYKNELTAMWCSFYGVTKYEDEHTNVTVRCPLYAGSRTIGKDVVVINNNEIRNPLLQLVNHYAQLLAHNETTIVNVLVNLRNSRGVPTVSTQKQKSSMKSYYNNLYNGKFDTVTDIANLNVEFIGEDKKSGIGIKELFETRSSLLKSFYSDIGIRAAFNKNNNAVTMEVLSDTSQLIFNLKDMLECRKKGAYAVNEMFGTNITVEIAPEIDYENQDMTMKEGGEIENQNE